MKYVIILVLCLCSISDCTGQNNKNKKEDMDEEKLDISRLARKGKKTVYDNGEVSYCWKYKEKDGTVVVIEGDKEDGYTESRIPKNSFREIYKEYYPSGILKFKGSLFGEHTKIGTWHYYDSEGNLVEEVDENKKFGKFGYIEVLQFLINNKYVDKDTFEGIFRIRITFWAEDLTWYIRVTTPGYIINEYEISGNTGEIKSHNVSQGGEM